jgi:hypothetical protein
MTAWITVAASLGGVGVGALISGITAWNLEKARHDREQAARWNDERRRLYVEYLRGIAAFNKATRELARKPEASHLRMEWSRWFEAMDALSEEIRLIATRPVRDAVETLTHTRYISPLGGPRDQPASSEEMSEWSGRVTKARVAFEYAARKELGVVD